MPATVSTPVLSTEAVAIVRAIRRAMDNPPDGPGLGRFTVCDVYAFAERLAREGVTATEAPAA